MRARFFAAAGTAALALAGSVLAASPALATTCSVSAAPYTCSATTTVTFQITAGSLSLAAPDAKNLGSVATSSVAQNVQGQLGNTTVTDARGALVGAYTVSISAGNFTTGTSTPPAANETILGATVTAWSGAASHTNPTTTKVPAETASPGVAATGVLPIMGLSAYSGTDVSTYNPTVVIPVPATNAAGAYSGTITQTVTAV